MYNTEQRKTVTDFFNENCERALTVEEVASGIVLYCAGRGIAAPGKSTVYRLISKMYEEEKLRRFARDDKRFAYQLAVCPESEPHLHMKCTGCGRLFHMEHSASDRLMREIMRDNGFSVDEEQTVLYGRCTDCGKKIGKAASTGGR
ncbi:MAG: transcriptional repressor [Clostridia bacterium]|nr:transcriptional repressor [Clostridia bacterium]